MRMRDILASSYRFDDQFRSLLHTKYHLILKVHYVCIVISVICNKSRDLYTMFWKDLQDICCLVSGQGVVIIKLSLKINEKLFLKKWVYK